MKEIPPQFYNSDSNMPFSYCKVCECELLENNKDYFIEKIMKRYPEVNTEEVLFEYAICEDCADKFHQQLSYTSRKNVQAFFQNRVRAIMDQGINPMIDTKHCLISGESVENTREYQLVAQAQGRFLRMTPPFMISGEILEQINEMLSAETRDELERFKGDNFGWPPELAEALGRGNLLLV